MWICLLYTCVSETEPYFKISHKNSLGKSFWDWFLGIPPPFHFWNLSSKIKTCALFCTELKSNLCFVLYRAVVIRLRIHSDTHACYCVESLPIVISKWNRELGAGWWSGINWDEFISAFQNTVWAQYNSPGQLWNKTLVLVAIRYFMGTDGTGEECVVKMLWQLIEFEVAFTSPAEIQLIFFPRWFIAWLLCLRDGSLGKSLWNNTTGGEIMCVHQALHLLC